MISAGKLTLNEVMEKLAAPVTPVPPAEIAKPKPIVLSPADKKALRTLPALLADLQVPQDREWTTAERELLVPIFAQVKVAKKAVDTAEKAIQGAAHDHLDAVTDGPMGKNGHKLTEGEILGADDYDQKIIRYSIGGNAVELTDFDLQELVDDGKITLAAYRRMTQPKTGRTVVPDAVMAEMAKDASVLEAIASKARRSDKTTGVKMSKV
jgi:hypothetical protein